MTLFEEVFAEYEAETLARQPVFGTEEWYRSGRVSKAWPEKENKDWWLENGPKFVELWTLWRDQSGLKISEFANTETGEMIPGIELDTWAERPERGLYLKSCIDRVMEDENGNLYIVDLKTGSSTDPWPLQMALNNLGLVEQYGVRAKYAGFWHSRKGGVEKWFDLDDYPDDFLWDIVEKAKKIRDLELFIPAPHSNLCANACGVRQFCTAMGGRRNLDVFLSTMQQ
jgi:hypothetical protein